MKSIPTALQTHLDTGATTTCWCWKVTRKDNVVLGFTNHNRDLTFDSVTYKASTGFTASQFRSETGMNVDNFDAESVLSSNDITDSDIHAGLYDNADLELFLVNWSDVTQRTTLKRGNMGRISWGKQAYTAEFRSLSHKVNQSIGKKMTRKCRHKLFDSGCKVDSLPYLGIATISSILTTNRHFVVTGVDSFADDMFTDGRAVFSSGLNNGLEFDVKLHTKSSTNVVTVEFWHSTPRNALVSDTMFIAAGCDLVYDSDCLNKFNNVNNFGGFPLMPGEDYVLTYPNTGEGNDGGSLL